jgi:crotonobetainyl-CoA:carnitine CoA-transferase CaiB-like acyl-CoA transferase
MTEGDRSAGELPLAGLRVVEVGAPAGEYCGLLFAGLGAEVVKVEPPAGAPSRRIGPFAGDVPDPERSLFHWAYNRGKRSVVIDPSSDTGAAELLALAATADVWVETVDGPSALPEVASPEQLRARFPKLIAMRISPFGDTGPWAGHRAGDLVHLALGGVLMNCGYDPGLDGEYDLPPSWPHAFHALHIAGEQAAMTVLAALYRRTSTGRGQLLSCSIHEAVSKATEVDLMSWVMLATPFHRQTGRHSAPAPVTAPTIAQTKDGRWLNSMTLSGKDRQTLRRYLAERGFGDPTDSDEGAPDLARKVPGTGTMGSEDELRDIELVGRLTRKAVLADVPWLEAQDAGVIWAPIRKPHENLADDHWQTRGTFGAVEHPELGRSLTYPVSKWISTTGSWTVGRRAPQLDEDAELLRAAVAEASGADASAPRSVPPAPWMVRERSELRGPETPWALENVRILDFSWFLASAGGTRFLSALGADCIKVEWHAHPDTRLGAGAPEGGRAARRAATGPLRAVQDPNMGGNFNHKNAGKRGISLNVRHPEGLAIAKALAAKSDVVAEGFSPGVMDRWGLGYDVLRELQPRIIYAQQSGMGRVGTYGRTRAVGPIAAALAGVTEMSGAPDPAPPAGWGYSYLDWLGAYSFASAILTALYARERTGLGQCIDASQCEVGIYSTAVPILDWQVNNRPWRRTGNRSPYDPVAPEGVYRCAGRDNWLAISCRDDQDWAVLAKVLGHEEWTGDARFATAADRLRHADELDALVESCTRELDRYDAMNRLQAAGVAAGVCQTAEDRCENDPQLAALGWLAEVTGTKIGTWPVGEYPVLMDETPGSIAGRVGRGAPCYGEDNYQVYEELLGLSAAEVDRLARDGIV